MNTTLYLRFMKHHRDKSEVKHNTQQPRQPPIFTPSVGVIQQQNVKVVSTRKTTHTI